MKMLSHFLSVRMCRTFKTEHECDIGIRFNINVTILQ
jgi:hypothetical protein